MPIIEIFVLIQVGSAIGALATIAIVIFTAILGTWMLRSQGLSTLNRARNRLAGGEIPAFQLLEGVALAVGGALCQGAGQGQPFGRGEAGNTSRRPPAGGKGDVIEGEYTRKE